MSTYESRKRDFAIYLETLVKIGKLKDSTRNIDLNIVDDAKSKEAIRLLIGGTGDIYDIYDAGTIKSLHEKILKTSRFLKEIEDCEMPFDNISKNKLARHFGKLKENKNIPRSKAETDILFLLDSIGYQYDAKGVERKEQLGKIAKAFPYISKISDDRIIPVHFIELKECTDFSVYKVVQSSNMEALSLASRLIKRGPYIQKEVDINAYYTPSKDGYIAIEDNKVIQSIEASIGKY